MGILFRNYVKRFRMSRPLTGRFPNLISSSTAFDVFTWHENHLKIHADILSEAFRGTLDARLFPNLGNFAGCFYLMETIANHPGILPESILLIRYLNEYVACIQALRENANMAVIQNVAVRPGLQGLGLGKKLLFSALKGLQKSGFREVRLEVSAKNDRAVRLYQSFGFEQTKTVYRETSSTSDEYTN